MRSSDLKLNYAAERDLNPAQQQSLSICSTKARAEAGDFYRPL